MNKKLKIGLIIFGVVGLSVASYFAINYFKLKKAAENQLSPEDIMDLIEEKTKDLDTEMEEDPDLQKKSTDSTGIMVGQEDYSGTYDYAD